MITIREAEADSKLRLVCLDVTLKTASSAYTISSEQPMIDSRSSLAGGLFGSISWPISRFRFAEGCLLEQQMFLPHDESAVAMSWALHSDAATTARLVVRPFFSGCGPRSYRDVGFRLDSEDNARPLSWLPHVRGPKVLADTNGQYHDEPVRLFDGLSGPPAASASEQDLITPGRFEFELGRRPSVLIFSMENRAVSGGDQHIGLFLAGLMEGSGVRAGSSVASSVGVLTQQLKAA